jgi:hypothetical protein
MAAGRHAVDKLLQVCEQSNKLSADDLAAVRAKRQLLIDRDILSPETVQYSSYEQLRDCGFTHGVAVCLKRVFPTVPQNQQPTQEQQMARLFLTAGRSSWRKRIAGVITGSPSPLSMDRSAQHTNLQ